MLTVYSTYGSPGASTTAIYLAAQWASSGRQVLLIETDAAAGSLSQKLGIQFTPGTASFVAAGKPVTAASLVEHAQDVLFSDLHVMPTPSSPSGAKTVADKFARLGEELRDISDSEMAVIVDGGRLTADSGTSELTTSAAAVLVVARDNTHLPSLEHVNGVLATDASQPGALGLVATVGPSPLSDAEWHRDHGLTLVGSVDVGEGHNADLSMFMSRNKRKSRKLRSSLEKLAGSLYEFAHPASASTPRARLPAHRPPADAAVQADDPSVAAGLDDLRAQPPPAEQHLQAPYGNSGPAPEGAYLPPGHDPFPHQHPQPQHSPQPGYDTAAHHYSEANAPPPYDAPAQPLQPPPLPAVEQPTEPTGSFRTWAAHLFGESAGGDPDENWPRPGAGASA